MDRPLANSERRRARRKKLAWAIGSASALLGLLVYVPGWLRPAVKRNDIRTARVSAGPLEEALRATGTIVPRTEVTLTAPIGTRVLKLLARPGAVLTAGEPLLELDLAETRREAIKVEQQIGIQENRRHQAELALDRNLAEIDAQIEKKKLAVEFLLAKQAQQVRLGEQGLASEEARRAARLEAEQAAVELRALELSRRNTTATGRSEVEAVRLEVNILHQEQERIRQLLDFATTRADRAGVLTWLVPDEGGFVAAGQPLAKIADLSAFRVQASVSDLQGGRLSLGQAASVHVGLDGTSTIAATVVGILPTVENGSLTFLLELERADDARLKPNLRVDVEVVLSRREHALRVDRGPGLRGGRRQNVFVVAGDRLLRREVALGISGFDQVEVIEGLAEGEEIVVSETVDIDPFREVALR